MKIKGEWKRLLAPVEGDGGESGAPNDSGLPPGIDIWDDAPPPSGEELYGGGEPEDTSEVSSAPVDPLAPAEPAEEPRYTMAELAQMQQVISQQAQPSAEPEKEMTEEEINEVLKVYRATPEFAQKMFHAETVEEQAEALNEMIQGVVTHLTTTMGYANNMVMQQLEGKFAPALDMVQEKKISNFTSALTDSYPTLQGHEDLIREVSIQLKQQGYQAKDGIEAGRVVAAQVEKLLKAGNPEFSLLAQAPKPAAKKTAMPKMASLPSGSGGGAGGNANSSSKAKKQSWNVFDD